MKEYIKYIKIINGEHEVEPWLKNYLLWDFTEKMIMFYLYQDKTLTNFIICCYQNLDKNIYQNILNSWIVKPPSNPMIPKIYKEKILISNNKTILDILQIVISIEKEILAINVLSNLWELPISH
jgi:hypothetical protein